ncbi:hypothetical protein BEWA_021100 [Theileria equi strain WA]|uniref:DNA/pantothenate metabolism flavoprotein C-terminal domain-containing protein n=1 Tax=Theileria equi strain WA TaxID=1537102 RepID=L0AVI8_THEEQ|nr:hypothetical protein BEWA_021100 [Theileria equi strain WA]AFZ79263.1 hypothetical protein BEWA_021100 [Theileria equi strain WA]|eukprot:XP_004828929.1 hypothetical protein BEWA_021100 [Theileria equi strain WA]
MGYFVIHLSRKNSHLPFLGKIVDYEHGMSVMDRLSVSKDGVIVFEPEGDQYLHAIKALKDYAENKNRLFVEHFTTVDEYQAKLKTIAYACTEFKEHVAFCLAAAVSDFKIPEANMPKEKLSSDSAITLHLEPVKKTRLLVRSICGTEPLLCCFKLATNEADLHTKANKMLQQPTLADMVVCNIFEDRKAVVKILYPDGSLERITDEDQKINENIAKSLANAHEKRIKFCQIKDGKNENI